MKAIKQIERLFCKGKVKNSKYFCIYKSGKLKWILPEEKKFALKIIENWKPYTLRSKLYWKTIQFLYHLRIPNVLFNVSSIKFSHENINWEKYGWPYDSNPKLSFYIGNGSSDQKISAIFINKDNLKIINVVKLPLGNNSWNLIKKEFDFLNKIKNKLNQKLPIAIYQSSENKYTVQSFLDGCPSKIHLTNAHYKFLGSLVYKNRLIELKYLGNYLENFIHNNSINLEKLKLLKNSKILLSELDWRGFFPLAIAHCDFAPWNIKIGSLKNIHVFDWEFGSDFGIPFYDLFYYKFQVLNKLNKNININLNYYIDCFDNKAKFKNNNELNTLKSVAKFLAFFNTHSQNNKFSNSLDLQNHIN